VAVNNHLILQLVNIVTNSQTFILQNISSQNAILLCRFVPRHLQMVRTFLNNFQISHLTWRYAQQTHSNKRNTFTSPEMEPFNNLQIYINIQSSSVLTDGVDGTRRRWWSTVIDCGWQRSNVWS